MDAIRFTAKGRRLGKQLKDVVDEWLEKSGLTQTELKRYKDVEGFYIAEDEDGFTMMYSENGEKKQLGVGLFRTQPIIAKLVFGAVCAYLDNAGTHTNKFTEKWIEWSAREGF